MLRSHQRAMQQIKKAQKSLRDALKQEQQVKGKLLQARRRVAAARAELKAGQELLER